MKTAAPLFAGTAVCMGLGLAPAVVVAPVVPAVIPVLVVVAPVAVVVAVPAPAALAAAVGAVGREHVSYSHCGIPFPPRWGDGHSPTSPCVSYRCAGATGFLDRVHSQAISREDV